MVGGRLARWDHCDAAENEKKTRNSIALIAVRFAKQHCGPAGEWKLPGIGNLNIGTPVWSDVLGKTPHAPRMDPNGMYSFHPAKANDLG